MTTSPNGAAKDRDVLVQVPDCTHCPDIFLYDKAGNCFKCMKLAVLIFENELLSYRNTVLRRELNLPMSQNIEKATSEGGEDVTCPEKGVEK